LSSEKSATIVQQKAPAKKEEPDNYINEYMKSQLQAKDEELAILRRQ